MPRLLFLLISHCNSEDILDVAQLMNQLCIKFKGDAANALDASLLPFLRKCHYLSNNIVGSSGIEINTGEMDAPAHLRIEQLQIQKLSYVVLQHAVVHRATALLLSPTNISSLEPILQSMSEGAIRVEDPLMKKTCLVFFRELLDQWVKEGNERINDISAKPPDYVIQGYIRFVCDVLVPGMIQLFLSSTNCGFNVEDANHFRCLVEFAGTLEILKNRLPDVYYQDVLVSKLSMQASLSQSIMEGFRSASSRKEFEVCLKALIQTRPQ
jgi:exportin-T